MKLPSASRRRRPQRPPLAIRSIKDRDYSVQFVKVTRFA